MPRTRADLDSQGSGAKQFRWRQRQDRSLWNRECTATSTTEVVLETPAAVGLTTESAFVRAYTVDYSQSTMSVCVVRVKIFCIAT